MNNLQPEVLENIKHVNIAYTAQAPLFDNIQNNNKILLWMRRQVYNTVEKYLRPHDRMLDINAGTGIDATYFARKGFRVTATDVADGMIKEIESKIEKHGLQQFLSARQYSYTEISALEPQKFDYVLSNFGGLNCIRNLSIVAEQLKKILNNNTFLTLVIMPPVCPWEILFALKRNFKVAFRRLRKEGVMARVEGHYFKAYYHTPEIVLKAFGDQFTLVELRGLASFVPPPYMEKFPERFPTIFKLLKKLDEQFSTHTPFNRWADQFIITLHYRSQ